MKKKSFHEMVGERLRRFGGIIEPVKKSDPFSPPKIEAAETWINDVLGVKDYADYSVPLLPPRPKPITRTIPLEAFSKMPCASAAQLLTALKMRERLDGNDMEKYDRILISITGDTVQVTFTVAEGAYAYGPNAYGLRMTASDYNLAESALNNVRSQALANRMAQQMANRIDRQILGSIMEPKEVKN